IGSEFRVQGALQASDQINDQTEIRLVLLSPNRSAYSEISALISRARRRSEKGSYRLHLADLQFGTQHCLAIWLPPRGAAHGSVRGSPPEMPGELPHYAETLASFFKERLCIGIALLQAADDQQYYCHCQSWANQLNTPMVACNNVHMHGV